MRCFECQRKTPRLAYGLCPACVSQSERAAEVGDGTSVEHCEFAGRAMDISGLPARTPLAETITEHADPAVPGAILDAPDIDRAIMLRNAGGGSA